MTAAPTKPGAVLPEQSRTRKRQHQLQKGAETVKKVKYEWTKYVDDTIATGNQLSIAFKAGRLKHSLDFWKSVTTDRNIISMVAGCSIELQSTPEQHGWPENYKFSNNKSMRVDREISKMLSQHVIEQIEPNEAGYVSNIFTRDKPDGSLRVILDLSEFNEHVTYRYFKMESLQTAITLMSPKCYMASIDWKDAYYSVPVATEFRKYLAFSWKGQMFQYTCLPNGLACAPRLFTKLSKVLFSELRKLGHVSTSYIDDCLLLATSKAACERNIEDTVALSVNAGFVVHPIKSVLYPAQKIVYLGFVLDSVHMTVQLTPERAVKLKNACSSVLGKREFPLQDLAQVIGLLVASFPGVQYGQMFYRRCDIHKNKVLKEGRGNYSVKTTLPEECKEDLRWWIDNIECVTRTIVITKPTAVLETDASNTGWGSCTTSDSPRRSSGGHWSND